MHAFDLDHAVARAVQQIEPAVHPVALDREPEGAALEPAHDLVLGLELTFRPPHLDLLGQADRDSPHPTTIQFPTMWSDAHDP